MHQNVLRVLPFRKGEWLSIPSGWLCYLSPEIIRSLHAGDRHDMDLPFTEASDVYAFGYAQSISMLFCCASQLKKTSRFIPTLTTFQNCLVRIVVRRVPLQEPAARKYYLAGWQRCKAFTWTHASVERCQGTLTAFYVPDIFWHTSKIIFLSISQVSFSCSRK